MDYKLCKSHPNTSDVGSLNQINFYASNINVRTNFNVSSQGRRFEKYCEIGRKV